MRSLLDTNVCIDYLTARYPLVVGRIQRVSPEDLCVSSIAAAELRYGADKSSNPSRNHARLDLFFAEMPCLEFDLEAAAAYGAVRAGLERIGRTIGAHDMLIAAHALSARLLLVTANVREFARVRGLALENWRL